jgi:hypothetical protein
MGVRGASGGGGAERMGDAGAAASASASWKLLGSRVGSREVWGACFFYPPGRDHGVADLNSSFYLWYRV